tara:strand:+ start:533 stop:838 length:306 start_codon:yes stop_codon:yes gene_type:complete
MYDFITNLWLTRDVLYRRDLLEEDTYGVLQSRQGVFDTPIRSVLDVPFSRGSLAVNSPEPEAFSARNIAVMRELATVLSEVSSAWKICASSKSATANWSAK